MKQTLLFLLPFLLSSCALTPEQKDAIFKVGLSTGKRVIERELE